MNRLPSGVRVVAVLLTAAALIGPAGSGERPAGWLPPCRPVPAAPAAEAPPGPPTLGAGACQAVPTRVEPAGGGQLPVPRPGYHHLGATTADAWSGITGRLTVRNPTVRARSYDFVATRFMAKRRLPGDRLGWLEVGWAETGWSGGGAQRVYTFDSTTMAWVFYDHYRVADGDQLWINLQSDQAGQWRAWLWWGQQWHLLATAADLALGKQAQLEQYVEVHQDGSAASGRSEAEPAVKRPDSGGTPRAAISVPPIRVDRVSVQAEPGAPATGWHAGTVPTAPQRTSDLYCLTWENQFDAWSAGDCAASVQE